MAAVTLRQDDDTPTLLDETQKLLEQRKARRPRVSLREIAEQAGVDFNWLSKFARGHIDDPGVKKVQRVHDCLRRLLSEAA